MFGKSRALTLGAHVNLCVVALINTSTEHTEYRIFIKRLKLLIVHNNSRILGPIDCTTLLHFETH